jgi:hypothetical protein
MTCDCYLSDTEISCSKTKRLIINIVITKRCYQRLQNLLNLANIFKINISMHSHQLLRLIFVVSSHKVSKPIFCSDFLHSPFYTWLNHFNITVQILRILISLLFSHPFKSNIPLSRPKQRLSCHVWTAISRKGKFLMHKIMYCRGVDKYERHGSHDAV